MNTLARHYIRQGDARGQHSHPHFTTLRLGALFLNDVKDIGSAVVSNDDARMFHDLVLVCADQSSYETRSRRSRQPIIRRRKPAAIKANRKVAEGVQRKTVSAALGDRPENFP